MRGTVGCGVLELAVKKRRGKVGAVFRRSAHLMFGDFVVTIGSFESGDHPYTVNLASLPCKFFSGKIFPGQKIVLENDSLIIGGKCLVLLNELTPFRPAQKVEGIAGNREIKSALNGVEVGVKALMKNGKTGFWNTETGRSKFENSIHKAALPGVRLVERGIRYKEAAALLDGSKILAGLGVGLTPSGDDFLVGVLSALHFNRLNVGKGFCPTLSVLNGIATESSKRTSTFSGMLIRCAARGWYSDLVSDWLAAVHKGNANSALSATRRLFAIGHSSGKDTLAGLLTTVRGLVSFQ